jgi:hypothetical protein
VYVKGGLAYDEYDYPLGNASDSNLHMPVNNGGNISTISHYLVCGTALTPPTVYAGYADTAHSTPPAGQFPSPWDGSAGVTSFQGCTGSCSFDGSAVRFTNNGSSTLTVSNVEIHVGNCYYSGWPSATLASGASLIVTQLTSGGAPSPVNCAGTSTNPANLGDTKTDASDLDPGGAELHGCPSSITPYVTASINGGAPQTFTDTHKVITDCIANPNGNHVEATNGLNESEPWQQIS